MSGYGHREAAERGVILLDILIRCAEAGEVAPTNHTIAQALGLNSEKVARFAVQRLERQGLITVARYNKWRIITIVATGKSTAGHIGTPHWSDLHAAASAEPKLKPDTHAASRSDPEPVRINREPCPLCGVRGDIGCRHSRQSARFLFVPAHFHKSELAQL